MIHHRDAIIRVEAAGGLPFDDAFFSFGANLPRIAPDVRPREARRWF
jgi:hypothetical protein